MRHVSLLAAALAIAMSIQGCATKTYGRQPDLSNEEMESMSCRDIELETAKVKGFVDRVDKESKFSGLDLVAFLIDFGIGNHLEKSSALDSAHRRLDQLQDQRYAKKCALQAPPDAVTLRAPAE